ncbi:MAG: helix-turn-helix domain-containing protein [Solirubrobacteraceae bacterium]
MARTRADVATDVKREAILEVAMRRFSESGYDETSMTSVARDAGVTVNTVYWYFANKDALLVAVAEHLRTQPTGRVPSETNFAELLLTASNAFDDVGKIVTAVHARAHVSELVGSWHADYHEGAERLLMAQANRHLESLGLSALTEPALRLLARLWVYALDGIITHGVPQDERRALCDEMVAQLERMARQASPRTP